MTDGISKVFVTGMGVLSPNGIGIDNYWSNTKLGISGIRTIDFFSTERNRVKVGGFIGDLDKIPFSHNCPISVYDRVSRLIKIAADEALADAGIRLEEIQGMKIGIIVGMAMGGMGSLERCYQDFFVEKTGVTTNEFIASMPNTPSSILSMEYGIKGLNYTINTACSSSAAAIGLAYWLLQKRVFDVCLTGGAEAPLTPVLLSNFERLKLLNSKSNEFPERASKPFSKDRNGFVLSEGAGVLVLESDEHVTRRNGKRMCEIIGYGASSDAFHIVAPDVNGQVMAIDSAFTSAGISPQQVDYIHAHGTSTRRNDVVETESIRRAYGKSAYNIPISSVKSMIGHTIGASASLSLICTVRALQEGFLPPTINLDVPDPECDLDYVPNVGREVEAKVAMIHSFGFGGNNHVIILQKSK